VFTDGQVFKTFIDFLQAISPGDELIQTYPTGFVQIQESYQIKATIPARFGRHNKSLRLSRPLFGCEQSLLGILFNPRNNP
jgi:hypothetical protein